MNSKNIDNICKELTTSRAWPRSTEAYEKLWNQIKEALTTPNEQITLLKCLAESDNIFKWLGLISWLIPELGSDDVVFVELLQKVVDKVKGDLAQGEFIRSLIRLGTENPEKGTALYVRITETSGNVMIHYSGLLLGGAARAGSATAFKKIEDGLKNENTAIVVACLKALRVAHEDSKDLVYPNIFDTLAIFTKSTDSDIQKEVVNAYIDFDKFDPETCGSKLLEIAHSADSEIRFTILNRLLVNDLQDKSNEFEILRACSRDGNSNVRDQLSYVLARKGQAFLEHSLEIIKEWIKDGKYYEIGSLDYCLSELGKNRIPECIKAIEQWIDSDRDPVFHQFGIPYVLRNIAASNIDELLTMFEQWIAQKNDDYKRIVIYTIADILLHHPSENAVSRCLSILQRFNEESTRSTLESSLFRVFGSRPLFADKETVIKIIDEWASNPDWKTRITSIVPLGLLAEYRIDSEETVQFLVNKETGETKIGAIHSKKVEHAEGVKAYELLRRLTVDENEEVRTQAQKILVGVDSRLKEKEKRIDEETKAQ
jgi:hypothetical protein